MSAPDLTAGLCECGCGQPTPLAPCSTARRGRVKGQPIRFIHGHNARKATHHVVEDRGYTTPCWIWQLHVNDDGHGRWTVNGRPGMAHRFYYEQRHGTLPSHVEVHHKCEVRACVNPDHLEPLTSAEHRRAHSRLTWADVAEIRRLKAEGTTLRLLSERFGMSQGQLCDIVNGKAWVA